MLIEVLCVCRRPPTWVRDVTGEYAKRLPRGFALEFVYVAPGHDRLDARLRRTDEATRLLKRVTAGAPLVALDDSGEVFDSAQFSARVACLRAEHHKLQIAIGGADGLGEAVFERAQSRWSLSRLTLPHLLVQVVLAEQIYRAWSIADGHPYHRA